MTRPYHIAPMDPDETERLFALQDYEILDTAPQDVFDDFTWLASSICGTPIALISLVDEKRQWFKSRVGLDASETPRDIAFCSHAILNDDIMEVANALEDERFSGNPLVQSGEKIRFYAGAPLTSAEGHNIGTLCVIDHKPRELSQHQKEALKRLSRQVIKQMEMQQMLKERQRTETMRRVMLKSLSEVASGNLQSSVFQDLISCVGQMINGAFVALHLVSDPHSFIASGDPLHPIVFYKKQAKHVIRCIEDKTKITRVRFEPPYLSLPIEMNGQALGVLSLAAQNQHLLEKIEHFLQPLVVSLSSLLVSHQKAQANHRLFERQQLQLQALQSLNDIASLPDVDLQAQIQNALQLGCQYYGFDAAVVCTVPAVAIGGSEDQVIFARYPEDLTEKTAELFLKKCKSRVRRETFHIGTEEDPSRFIHTLLELEQVVAGSLYFESASGDRTHFSKTDQEFVRLLTRWVASTLARYNNQQEREKNETLLEMTGRVANVGGWEMDLSGSKISWTQQTHRIHEVPDDYEPSLEKAISFYAPEARPIVQAAVAEAMETGNPWDLELPFVTAKNNNIWVRAVGAVQFEDGNPVRVYGAFQDITERKQGERIKREFISTMNHELRTPLTSIAGALSMLANKRSSAENNEKLLDIARKNTARLTELINDLLDIEKIAVGALRLQLKTLEVNAMIKEILYQRSSISSQYNTEFIFENSDEMVYGSLDALRFSQVMNNLFSNAAKFSQDGSQVHIHVIADAKHWRIDVSNRGEKIASSLREKIFERFVQGDSSDTRHRGGSGLGLAITKELTEAMNGQIEMSSEAGINTFSVTFPRVGAETIITEETARGRIGADAPLKYQMRVLMIEDDQDLFHIITGQCQELAEFDYAANLKEARKHLRESVYDMVLLDIGLPDGSGFELLPAIRAQPMTPEIIVLSAEELNQSQHNMVDEALVKSRYSPEVFLEWLRQRLLEKKKEY